MRNKITPKTFMRNKITLKTDEQLIKEYANISKNQLLKEQKDRRKKAKDIIAEKIKQRRQKIALYGNKIAFFNKFIENNEDLQDKIKKNENTKIKNTQVYKEIEEIEGEIINNNKQNIKIEDNTIGYYNFLLNIKNIYVFKDKDKETKIAFKSKTIGQGSFGKVKALEVYDTISDGNGNISIDEAKEPTYLALKNNNITGFNQNTALWEKRTDEEIETLKNLEFENINNILSSKKPKEKKYFTMPLYEGAIKVKEILKLYCDDKIKIFEKIASDIEHMSEKKIIHNDLKIYNIFYTKDQDSNIIPIVGDYGLASKDRVTGGSLLNQCPEKYTKDYNQLSEEDLLKGDVYSFGIILLTICCGYQNESELFDNLSKNLKCNLNKKEVYDAKAADYKLILKEFENPNSTFSQRIENNFTGCHKNLKNLILEMINIDPKNRCNIKYVREMIIKSDRQVELEIENEKLEKELCKLNNLQNKYVEENNKGISNRKTSLEKLNLQRKKLLDKKFTYKEGIYTFLPFVFLVFTLIPIIYYWIKNSKINDEIKNMDTKIWRVENDIANYNKNLEKKNNEIASLKGQIKENGYGISALKDLNGPDHKHNKINCSKCIKCESFKKYICKIDK